MSAGYFLKRGEKVFGPHTLERVKELRDTGKLKPTDLIATSNKGPFVDFTKAEAKLFPTSKAAPQQAKPVTTAVVEPVNLNLVKCEDCGSIISKKASACPSCGAVTQVAGDSIFPNLDLPEVRIPSSLPTVLPGQSAYMPVKLEAPEPIKNKSKKSRKALWIGLSVGALVSILGVGGIAMFATGAVNGIFDSSRNSDPVAAFEGLVPKSVVDCKYTATSNEKTFYYRLVASDFKYDVTKSDSLVSPYVGAIEFSLRKYLDIIKSEENRQPSLDGTLEKGDDFSARMKYSYRDGKWVLTEFLTRQIAKNIPGVTFDFQWKPIEGNDFGPKMSKVLLDALDKAR